jgi:RNA polymerase sigma-B factor
MAPADTESRTTALFERIAATDDAEERRRLRHEVVLLHLPAARRVAARYTGRGESFDDLQQVACIALVKAARSFDPGRGTTFAAYAVPSMHGEVKRHFRDHGWVIRPPRHIQDSRTGVNEAVATLTQDLGRRPTHAEVAAVTGLDDDTVRACLASNDIFRLASIDALPQGGDGAAGEGRSADLAAFLGGADERLEAIEERLSLRPLIAALDPRERRLLALRFGQEWTQAQIASDFGVSQVQVSRLLTKVLTGLRQSLAAAA